MSAGSDPAAADWELTFPALFTAVDEAATGNQKTLLGLRKVEFAALVLAAGASEIPGDALWGFGPVATVLLFVLALVLRVSRKDQDAEKTWYDSRAAAESVKSLTWQYAVGGEAFRTDDPGAAGRYTDELKAILNELKELDVPAAGKTRGAVTSEMQALRDAALPTRIDVYRRLRVEDQLEWYKQKAEWNKTRAGRWGGGMIAAEAIAVLLGLGRALGMFDVDWLSIFAALAAVLAAWQQTKNYLGLSNSYSVTSHDVTLVAASLHDVVDEAAWSQVVHDAEAAFSREHTVWRARRQGPIRT